MTNGTRSTTLTIGWVLLLILGVLMTLGGTASMFVAYGAADDPIAEVSLARLAEINPEIPLLLRGRRATAASLALSYGILLAWIAWGPYRRAEKWARNAVAVSLGLGSILTLLRSPLLGTSAGMAQAGVALAIMVVALAVSYRDFN